MSDLDPAAVKTEFAAYIGIDWADQKHFWTMRTADGNATRGTRQHSRSGPGSVITMLCKYGHLVLFPLHPNTLTNYRKAFSPSGAKTPIRAVWSVPWPT